MCNELIIYPGNLLEITIEANTENEDGTIEALDLTIYDEINIHFKVTRDSEPLIELSTQNDGGLTIDENQIIVSKEISEDIAYIGPVLYDIECINEDGKTTYGPGTARIEKKITNPPATT